MFEANADSEPVLTAHPFADRFPMLSEEELQVLAADIAENGLQHPIVVDSTGLILDGRNRYQACLIAGVEPEATTTDADPAAFVLSANVHRRHIAESLRAAATVLVLNDAGKRKNGRWEYGSIGTNSTNSSWRQRVKEATLVLDHAPELLPEIASGALALDAALKQANEKRNAELEVLAEQERMAAEESDAAQWHADNNLEITGPSAVASKATFEAERARADNAYRDQLAKERIVARKAEAQAAEKRTALAYDFSELVSALTRIANVARNRVEIVMADYEPALMFDPNQLKALRNPETYDLALAAITDLKEWSRHNA
ncbi:MAG: ParB N-terminal domain-containing protein [Promicromonosporaceae bacterium]|nr:ParB N-terminal domain-containing protein [Promicromonosporaceae bacterium]